MNNSLFTLCDAHTHMEDPFTMKERMEAGIFSLVCTLNPREAAMALRLAEKPEYARLLLPTFGIHPWHAGGCNLQDVKPWLLACPVIGEIGMDSVWCSVPLEAQEKIFREQLAFACEEKKPVILHTKGQEQRIAAILKEYPNTYLVHWYSCGEYLSAYLELDCYFSIGPDVGQNQAVQKTAAAVPLNRILVETDGMGAVRWAFEGRNDCPENPAQALRNTLQTVAAIRRIEVKKLTEQVRNNLSAFLD